MKLSLEAILVQHVKGFFPSSTSRVNYSTLFALSTASGAALMATAGGTLKVTVLSAENLPKVEIVRGCDAYATVSFQGNVLSLFSLMLPFCKFARCDSRN